MAATLAFTLAEAATVLNPPLSEHQLRMIVRALGWQPCGKRYTGKGGHPFATYDAARLMQLHAVLLPYLDAPATAGGGDGVP